MALIYCYNCDVELVTDVDNLWEEAIQLLRRAKENNADATLEHDIDLFLRQARREVPYGV